MATAKKKTDADNNRQRNGVALIIGTYVLLVAVLIVAFTVRSDDVRNAKELACQANLDNKELLAYVISNSQGDPNALPQEGLPPEIQEIIEASKQSQARFLELAEQALLEPVAICEEVGIESRVDLPEPLPPVDSTTTTTEG